ncbi:MAG: hypothetical protein AAFZ65_14695 [Planctomycetota bacterium]
MHAQETLRTLCLRHGIDEAFGRRLLPLLERAAGATPDVRDRLVRLVEQSFERESERREQLRQNVHLREDEALLNVARALHGWDPPENFDPNEHRPEDLDPERREDLEDEDGGFGLSF